MEELLCFSWSQTNAITAVGDDESGVGKEMW